MTSFFQKLRWWAQRRRKEDEFREELQFHLNEETEQRRADGLGNDEARWAARRDLGNVTLLHENTRVLWTWTLLEQLVQAAAGVVRDEQPRVAEAGQGQNVRIVRAFHILIF